MAPREGGLAGRFLHVTRAKSGSTIVVNVVCFPLVAAIAAGWFALGQLGEVEIHDGLERLGRSTGA